MTIHDVIKKLKTDLNLTPEDEFRVTALIKRLIHHEKQSVYQRYAWYAKGYDGQLSWKGYFKRLWESLTTKTQKEDSHLEWLRKTLEGADQNHRQLSVLPDKEIVTWDVGSHVYNQRKKSE